jgi:hypothetical protein
MKKCIGLAALAAALLSGCGLANPWPTPPSPSSASHVLLVVGDSLAGQGDVTLPDVLAGEGLPTTVIDAHVNGSGLLGPVGDQPTALAYVTERVAAHPEADTVLVEWAGACGVCGTTVDGVTFPVYGEGDFYAQWTASAHAIIDYLHSQGKLVVWAKSPPVGADSSTAASGSAVAANVVLVLGWLTMSDLAPYASAGRVDWYVALSGLQAEYETDLFYDSALHTVRTGDLVHFTLDGSTRASTWSAKGLGDVWASLPAPPAGLRAQSAPGLVQAGDPVTLDVPAGAP